MAFAVREIIRSAPNTHGQVAFLKLIVSKDTRWNELLSGLGHSLACAEIAAMKLHEYLGVPYHPFKQIVDERFWRQLLGERKTELSGAVGGST